MLQFQKSSLISAPLETVWAFYRQTDSYQRLLPPWQPVQIIQPASDLVLGARTEYRLWLGLLPLRWVNQITEVVPEQSFTEEATTGLMEFWQHCYLFERCGEATQLTDTITYVLPGGVAVEQLLDGWVTMRLSDMFEYRHRIIQEYCRG